MNWHNWFLQLHIHLDEIYFFKKLGSQNVLGIFRGGSSPSHGANHTDCAEEALILLNHGPTPSCLLSSHCGFGGVRVFLCTSDDS